MAAHDLVPFLIEQGREWIAAERARHRPLAAGLPSPFAAQIEPFFGDGIVNIARFRVVPIIDNPPFFAGLDPPPIDFREMSGVTFADTVLISQARMPANAALPGLIFHELVQVVQYQLLGIPQFAQLYVEGWAANGFQYAAIPLERMAYDLAGRFEAAPDAVFSAVDEVRSRLGLAG